VIGIALTLWLTMMLTPPLGAESLPAVVLAVPLSICAVFITLGALTLSVRSPLVIQATMGFLALGLIVDLLLGFNVVKLLISGGIAWLIIKTGNEALQEAGKTAIQRQPGSA
jgi:hypothetical protein